MRLLEEERGISLVEVAASIVLITIILISFFTFFIQSKKLHVTSESVVDATYIAQQEMEEIYGLVSSNKSDWLISPINKHISLQGGNFIYDPSDLQCKNKCKKFLSTDNPEHWVLLQPNPDHSNLVIVYVNVPRDNSALPVVMESIFRWRD